MPFGAALSQHPIPAEAAGEVLGEVLERVGPEPDLAVLFATAPLTGAMEDIAATVRSVLRPRSLLGSTAVSVLAGDREVEEESALSLWAGTTGAVETVRLETVPSAEGVVVRGLPEASAPHEVGSQILVLLADPFTFAADRFLEQLAVDRPGLRVIGGLASSARGPGGNRLVLDGDLHHDGAVGVLVDTDSVQALVSQGCRPIGDPMIVTRAERNVVYTLAGRPALDRLMELAETASSEDRALMGRGLHLGVVVDETRLEFGRGDFLVRNVLGGDQAAGAIAVGDEVAVGTTVQFQVRDADTADEDLRALLAGTGHADGALVFTCNGRGTHLFGVPHHDAGLVAEATDRRCAGMFCAGEIGPIGPRSFLHGFTASIALFRDP
ncbi:MAG: FIST N-terminal domain-containing protein [Acidimicrobiales bacterium]